MSYQVHRKSPGNRGLFSLSCQWQLRALFRTFWLLMVGLGGAMSSSYTKGAWEVRWRDSTGRQRSRRFSTEEAAREFDGTLTITSAASVGARTIGTGEAE